mmetsp:Transcript_3882/g.5222  ORF Transcript_3882/g.5222 Transcript_3882/m.5222 type:complete len:171 (-) Transcript_3882:1559-2071(-)
MENQRKRKRKRTFGSNKQDKNSSAVVSIKSFVNRGENKVSLYRERKRKEFIKNAKVVNRYKRLLKREGRLKDSTVFNKNDSSLSAKNSGEKKRKRKVKTDAFLKAKQKASELEQKKIDSEKAAEERETQKKLKKAKRKEWTKKLSKRTRKGQPILNNMLGNLLERIEKEG